MPNSNHEVITANIQRRANAAPAQAGIKTGIKNVHIFDGIHFLPREVAIAGDKITFNIHNVTNWIDAKGGFLLPGLIDAHCHPGSVADLHQMSSYGVTTALNMNCPNAKFCESLRNQTGVTSFFTANQGIVGLNSPHAKIFSVAPQACINSTDEAPQFVNWGIGNQSDWIKIVAEPDGPSQAEHNALVAYSHQKGLFVTTHASDSPSYQQAIDSKTDGIQHTPGDGYLTPAMITAMKKNNKWVTPTTSLVQAFIASPEALALSSYTNASWPIVVKNVKMMHAAGLPILAGTDAVSAATSGALHLSHPLGSTLHYELENLVNAIGLRPAEALAAATVLPAKYHQLHDRGVIAEGHRADLLLLHENPLKNISATRNIARVWNGGVQYTNISSVYSGQ